MAGMTVKNVQLWILHGADRKGLLADALEPLAAAGANLRVVMGYRYPAELDRAAVEVFPIEPAAEAAARKAGFQPSETPCLLVEGDDRKGLGAEISRALADAGINMGFLVAETIGKKFSAACDEEGRPSEVSRTIGRHVARLKLKFEMRSKLNSHDTLVELCSNTPSRFVTHRV